MKYGFWTVVVLAMLSFAGCTHEVKMQPVKVEPIHLTLDINVTLQQQEIEEAAAVVSPVKGKPAPDFTLPDQDKKPVTLSTFRSKWVVLYFYPKDDTMGCTLEAKDFTVLLPRFHEMNAEVLGVSEDSVQSHCDFIAKHRIKLTLLSDPDHQVMERYGAWVISSLGDLNYGRVIRTTMIVDPNGIIRHYMPEVMPQGHGERVLKKLTELQGASPAGQ
ncbi:MAG TPA: peroxiredoxin [Sedimentisphaerales bacterium]|jgi:peroxiredoxin Q/BCP|nr:peroxiredoxin [Sedimentisphaerales bacterium]